MRRRFTSSRAPARALLCALLPVALAGCRSDDAVLLAEPGEVPSIGATAAGGAAPTSEPSLDGGLKARPGLLHPRHAARIEADLATAGRAFVLAGTSPPPTADEASRRAAVAAAAGRLVASLDAKHARAVQPYVTFPVVALEVDLVGLAQLLAHPEVAFIESNQRHRPSLAQSVPLVDANASHAVGQTGAGVGVGVIDSGIRETHQSFTGKLLGTGFHSLDNTADQGTGGIADTLGHGTHVAGIVAQPGTIGPAGAAPGASVFVAKVFPDVPDPTAWTLDILAAVDHIVVHRNAHGVPIRVMNLSLGGGQYLGCNCDATNGSYKSAFDAARSNGILPVVASGNEAYQDALASPACVSSALSVGAVYDQDYGGSFNWSACTDTGATLVERGLTCFTNRNACLDITAPGALLTAAGISSDTAMTDKGGTSMAAPMTAGVAALVAAAEPSLTAAQIELALLASQADPVGDQTSARTFPYLDAPDAIAWARCAAFCASDPSCVEADCSPQPCAHVPAVCDDGDACTTDTCNPATGCQHAAKDCSSEDTECALGACDAATGACVAEARPTGFNVPTIFLPQIPGNPLLNTADLEVEANGDILTINVNFNVFIRFDAAGNYKTWFGGQGGAGDGQFSNPYGFALDAAGNLVVADQFNHRVQVVDNSGGFVSKFGSQGTANGQFQNPLDVAVNSSGEILVADTINHRVQKFDAAGNFVAAVGDPAAPGSGLGQFQWPAGIAVDASDNVYVADRHNGRVVKLDPALVPQIAFGSSGSAEGQLGAPPFTNWFQPILVDAAGQVVVADSPNNRVCRWTSAGVFVDCFGSAGTGPLQLDRPLGLGQAASGDYLVNDSDEDSGSDGPNDRVQIVSEATIACGAGNPCNASAGTCSGEVCSGQTFTSSCCGNGSIDAGEQCDDGNGLGGDGCSATCQIDLVGHWPFDDAAGAGTVADLGPYGRAGVTNGTGITQGSAGRIGAMLEIDGDTSSSVTIADGTRGDQDPTDALTVSAWINMDTTNTANWPPIFKKEGTFWLRFTQTHRRLEGIVARQGAGNCDRIFSAQLGSAPLTTGAWHHVAMVYDSADTSQNLRMYVNGAELTTTAWQSCSNSANAIAVNNSDIAIATGGFDGRIDDIKQWRVARTPAEICGDAGGAWDGANCSYPSLCDSVPVVCPDDGDPCTIESCDPVTGTCLSAPAADGTACDDGLYCNGADTCQAGVCAHAGNPCPGADGDTDCSESCSEGTDSCTAPDADGTVCDDGLFCTGSATCAAGVCGTASGDPCPGADGDGDCSESCDEAANACTAADPNGSACDDGQFCTATDTCAAGVCSGIGDPCPGPDGDGDCTESCDEAANACTGADPNGSACDDGLFCSGADTCAAGACNSAGDPCPGPDGDGDCAETCSEASNACVAFDTDGAACDDGDACTVNDQCTAGSCGGTQSTSVPVAQGGCDDGVACTVDFCNAGSCSHVQSGCCPNGNTEPFEECDDNNSTPGDGCSPDCRVDRVAHWRLDEASGATAAVDSGPYGRDGVPGGAVSFGAGGPVGGASADFPGISGANITVADTAGGPKDPLGTMTVEAWFHPRSADTSTFPSFAQKHGSWWFRFANNGRLEGRVERTDGSACDRIFEPVLGSGGFALNQWHHAAMVYDANASPNLRFFLDGAELTLITWESCGASTAPILVNDQPIVLGHAAFDGRLDDVQIWRLARTQAEICVDAGGSWDGAACSFPDPCAAVVCPDTGNPCTESNCDSALAECVVAPAIDGLPCDDGIFCNGFDSCAAGVCAHDGDPCLGPDLDADCAESCDEATDACTAADPDGSACDDGLFCTGPGMCAAGSCALAGNPCAGPDGDGDCAETCDEFADACTAADADGSGCDDGDVCTLNDTCAAGLCAGQDRGTIPVASGGCDDGLACTEDFCVAGACENPPVVGDATFGDVRFSFGSFGVDNLHDADPANDLPDRFRSPEGVATSSTGEIYVTDSRNERVKVFDGQGNFLRHWGGPGSGPGQFALPMGLAVGPDRRVYVADLNNHRVQYFTPSGTFLGAFGSHGSGAGQYDQPSDVAVDHLGRVVIADRNNGRLVRTDAEGGAVEIIGAAEITTQTTGVAVDDVGNIYGTDGGAYRIHKFDDTGAHLWTSTSLGPTNFRNASDVAVLPGGLVAVAVVTQDLIAILDAATGAYSHQWGVSGSGPGELSQPTRLAVDALGQLFVADSGSTAGTGNHRISVYGPKPCDDGVFCNGADACGGGTCSVHAGDPCPVGDLDADCAEACDEAADSCSANDPDGTACNDGSSCLTGDVCTAGVCSGAPAAQSDATCDGVDDDCDGQTDEDYVAQSTSCGVGECGATGETSCVGGVVQDSCTPGTSTSDANCNGVDDDCDGATDEHYVVQNTSCGVGECAETGETSCVGGAVQDSCTPGASTSDANCNGLDDDCDGATDEHYVVQNTSCGVGECGATGETSCVGGAVQDSCTPGMSTSDANCNGLDDDCDGATDEHYVTTPTACGSGACAGTGTLRCIDASEVDDCAPVADGTACSDGIFCNGADTCAAGACTAHAGNPCPGPDGDGDCSEVCDEAAGACTANDADGAACDDGNACTSGDACAAGTCAGAAVDCDDDNVCSVDACDTVAGCQYAAAGPAGCGGVGSGSFAGADQPASVDRPAGVAAGDVNGDGQPDLVVASRTDGRVTLLLGAGGGAFAPGVALDAAAPGAYTVALADLDGDSDLDVVAGLRAGGEVRWYAGDGAGAFAAGQVLPGATPNVRRVAVADVDADGKPDVFATSWTDGAVVWWRNQGGGLFAARQTAAPGLSGASGLALADLDGDGALDVLACAEISNTVGWARNLGGGTFGALQILSTTVGDCSSVAAGDLDGDGVVDVAAAQYNPKGMLTWWRGTGGGAFAPRQTVSSMLRGPRALQLVDLDGDGWRDMVAVSTVLDEAFWQRNQGGGSFAAPVAIATGLDTPWDLAPFDADGDGDLDFATVSSDDDRLVVHLQGGTLCPTCDDGAACTVGDRCAGQACAGTPDDSLCADGDACTAEVCTAGGCVPSALQSGAGCLDAPSGTFGTDVLAAGADSAVGVAVGDVNGDGAADIVGASANDQRISWFAGAGDGTFGPRLDVSANAFGVWDVELADLDGDGDLDVLAGLISLGDVVWYRADGAGSFGGPEYLDFNAYGVRDVDAVDLNGDGAVDVVAASTNDDKLSTYLAFGGGHFQPRQVVFAGADGAAAVDAGDLDGDGTVDLALASMFDDSVRWLAGAGDGTFAAPVTLTSSLNEARSVRVADVDGDGKNDVIATQYNPGGSIVWWPSLGGGTFGAMRTVATSIKGPRTLRLADLDGDGDLDVLGLSTSRDRLLRFDNLGGGLFAAEADLVTGLDSPWDVVAADLDGDGDLDLAAANRRADTFTAHLQADALCPSCDDGVACTINDKCDGAGCTGTPDDDLCVAGLPCNDGTCGAGGCTYAPISQGPCATQPSGTFTGAVIATGADGAYGVATGDLDGDGLDDVVSASLNDGVLGWQRSLGGGSFGARVALSGAGDGAADAQVVDIDGDGRSDVLASLVGRRDVVWYPGDGAGGLGSAQLIDGNVSGGFRIESGDADGDGDRDVVSASFYSDTLWLHRNLGGGIFAAREAIATGADGAGDVALADLDGDGDADPVWTAYFDQQVAWAANDGAGHFGTPAPLPGTIAGALTVQVADLDGDGDLDVAATQYSPGGSVYIWGNDGAGSFATPVVLGGALSGPRALALVDDDRDGDLDVFVASSSRDLLFRFDNLGGLGFGPEVPKASGLDGAWALANGRLDADGDLDLVIAARHADTIVVLTQDGTTCVGCDDGVACTAADICDSGGCAGTPRSADCDDDNICTLDTCTASGCQHAPAPSTTACDDGDACTENDTCDQGSCQAGPPLDCWALAGACEAATCDPAAGCQIGDATDGTPCNDGDPCTLADACSGGACVGGAADDCDDGNPCTADSCVTGGGCQHDPLGDAASCTPGASGQFVPHVVTAQADRIFGVTAGDFDGDGDLDLARASLYDGVVAWHANDGAGGFAGPQIVDGAAPGPIALDAADLDSDGDVDLVVGVRNYSKIYLYRNAGAGAFQPRFTLDGLARGVEQIVTVDLDGDGAQDVVAALSGDDEVRWYRGLGGGVFGPPATLLANADGVMGVAVGDVDGDGRRDVVAASYFDDAVRLLLQTAPGTFAAPLLIDASAATANGVSLGDVDGDGDLDLLVAGYSVGGNTWLYRGDGAGNFTAATLVASGISGARRALLTDLDRDGDLDIAGTSAGHGNVYVQYNAGGGTFGGRQVVVAAPTAWEVIAADLDGDGDVDLAATSPQDDSLRALLQSGTPCLACFSGGVCDAGACACSTVADCDDGDPCTVDACEAPGVCAHAAGGCAPDAAGACADGDGDGYGSGGAVCAGTDCDDRDPQIHAGAHERCDGKDNDCDATIDEQCSCVDGDTLPCLSPAPACPAGQRICANGAFGPCQATGGQPEVCDGADNDCDGLTDEDLGTVSCGTGACANTVAACHAGQPQGCSPRSASTEVCDGVDNDCDGQIDEGIPPLTCGEGACAASAPACNDGAPGECTPGDASAETCDGVDNDCDGETDEDLGFVTCGEGLCAILFAACDGGVSGGPCTPNTAAASAEVCDGLDNDCDGLVDEDLGTVTCGVGACVREIDACAGGVPQTCVAGDPSYEMCDGIDNDCDGETDNGTTCDDAALRSLQAQPINQPPTVSAIGLRRLADNASDQSICDNVPGPIGGGGLIGPPPPGGGGGGPLYTGHVYEVSGNAADPDSNVGPVISVDFGDGVATDIITCRVGGVPTWIHDFAPCAVHTVTLRATDGDGLTTQRKATIRTLEGGCSDPGALVPGVFYLDDSGDCQPLDGATFCDPGHPGSFCPLVAGDPTRIELDLYALHGAVSWREGALVIPAGGLPTATDLCGTGQWDGLHRTFTVDSAHAIAADNAGGVVSKSANFKVGNQPPLVVIDGPGTRQVVAGESFYVTGTWSDPDGTIADRRWETSDGRVAAVDTHRLYFADPGTHTVKLVVTDDGGLRRTDQIIVDVAAAPPGVTYDTAALLDPLPGDGATAQQFTVNIPDPGDRLGTVDLWINYRDGSHDTDRLGGYLRWSTGPVDGATGCEGSFSKILAPASTPYGSTYVDVAPQACATRAGGQVAVRFAWTTAGAWGHRWFNDIAWRGIYDAPAEFVAGLDDNIDGWFNVDLDVRVIDITPKISKSTFGSVPPVHVQLWSTLPWGPPATAQWTFGDGTPGATTTGAVHTYAFGGAFDAWLDVTYANGWTARSNVLSTTVLFDTDGDGVFDHLDADDDDDGVLDVDDAFPRDPTQTSDRDLDGYGDDPLGDNPDQLPDDPTEHLDTDGDGVGDGVDTDDDGDGLSDADEAATWGTDPRNADSDYDGIPDGEEAAFWGADALIDHDGDGLACILDMDSDGDGLRDGEERDRYTVELANTSPFADGDGDGLANILDPDADDDGVLDGFDDAPLGELTRARQASFWPTLHPPGFYRATQTWGVGTLAGTSEIRNYHYTLLCQPEGADDYDVERAASTKDTLYSRATPATVLSEVNELISGGPFACVSAAEGGPHGPLPTAGLWTYETSDSCTHQRTYRFEYLISVQPWDLECVNVGQFEIPDDFGNPLRHHLDEVAFVGGVDNAWSVQFTLDPATDTWIFDNASSFVAPGFVYAFYPHDPDLIGPVDLTNSGPIHADIAFASRQVQPGAGARPVYSAQLRLPRQSAPTTGQRLWLYVAPVRTIVSGGELKRVRLDPVAEDLRITAWRHRVPGISAHLIVRDGLSWTAVRDALVPDEAGLAALVDATGAVTAGAFDVHVVNRLDGSTTAVPQSVVDDGTLDAIVVVAAKNTEASALVEGITCSDPAADCPWNEPLEEALNQSAEPNHGLILQTAVTLDRTVAATTWDGADADPVDTAAWFETFKSVRSVARFTAGGVGFGFGLFNKMFDAGTDFDGSIGDQTWSVTVRQHGKLRRGAELKKQWVVTERWRDTALVDGTRRIDGAADVRTERFWRDKAPTRKQSDILEDAYLRRRAPLDKPLAAMRGVVGAANLIYTGNLVMVALREGDYVTAATFAIKAGVGAYLDVLRINAHLKGLPMDDVSKASDRLGPAVDGLFIAYNAYQAATASNPIETKYYTEQTVATTLDAASAFLPHAATVQFAWGATIAGITFLTDENKVAADLVSSPATSAVFLFQYFVTGSIPAAISQYAADQAVATLIDLAVRLNGDGHPTIPIPPAEE